MYEKPNPFALKRPSRAIRALELTDSNHEGLVVKVRIRALDALDASNAEVLAKELKVKYVEKGLPFPAIDGEALELNEEILSAVAMVYYAQCGDEDSKFTPEELLAFSVTTPEIWSRLLVVCSDLLNDSPLGKAMRIAQMPALLSSDGESDTQNSTAE